MSKSKVFLTAFVVFAVFFVAWRYEQETRAYEENKLAAFAGTNQRVRFEARITEDPENTSSGKKIVLTPDFAPRERVLMVQEKSLRVAYGDRVEVVGVLESPGTFDDFNYADYLAKDHIYALMYQGELAVKEKGAYKNIGERAFGGMLAGKEKLRDVLHAHLAPPESTILAALVLGDKGLMSEETKENLNRAGLRHITAISGMHVAIFTANLMIFLIWLGLWRQHAFYITCAIMILFIVFTGLQPSAVRAGIMGGMLLLGAHIGRMHVSWRALVFAAGIMLMINPLLLTKDAGFQLSFLAVLGIIALLPLLLLFLPQKLPLRNIMAMTIAAQVFTLPILIFNFGQVSVVSVLTNLLVVPFLPLIMGLGYLFLFAGLVSSMFGFLFVFPVAALLQYVLFVADVFGKLPFAALKTEHLSALWLIPFYALVFSFYWKFRRRGEAVFLS